MAVLCKPFQPKEAIFVLLVFARNFRRAAVGPVNTKQTQ